MAMYMCPNCGMGVSAGKEHEHKCKPIPFNVLNTEMRNNVKRDPDRDPQPSFKENKFA